MRFDNKAGYNQLMIQDRARPVKRPVQGKLGLGLLMIIAIGLGLAIGLAS